jgi:anti-anti-sigma regulatory factor
MFEKNHRPAFGYKSSKNTLTRMAAIKAGPAHVELVVTSEELVRAEGAAFAAKFASALADHPKTLVVNLCHTQHLTSSALGHLLRARAEAVRRGIRFLCKPANPETTRMLTEMGLGEILGLAA